VSAARDRGFVAIEWVAAITLLLIPAVVLAASLPTWAERRHAATVAAREAARELDREWPNVDPQRAESIAELVAADEGVAASDVQVHVIDSGSVPGSQIRVAVTVRMPAVTIAGLAHAGTWTFTATAVQRVDDYRSR
jgi:hypothetical protein